MASWYRMMDWPLRAKMAALLVAASLVPLAISFWISIGNARQDNLRSTATVLALRADTLAGRIDTFNDAYLHSVNRLARIQVLPALLQAKPSEFASIRATLDLLLRTWPESDNAVRGAAVLDVTGKVVGGTEPQLVGKDLGYHSFVKAALGGIEVVSDIYLSEPELGEQPTVAYLAPVRTEAGKIIGVGALWVRGAVLTDLLSEANGKAGDGSFGTLFDGMRIRIAHSSNPDMLFHPARPLPAGVIDALVAERRFGERTRELVQDVRAVDMPAPTPISSLDPGMFRTFVPGNQQWNYSVGRQCATTAWSVYYALPQDTLSADMARIVRQKLVFAGVIMVLALLVGTLFAAVILRPVRQLAAGARALGAGNLDARVSIVRQDELGELGQTFNGMAARIQQQADELRRESEAQYRQLFETLTEAFFKIEMILDDQGRPVDYVILEANREFELQSRLRDFRGKRRSELDPPAEDYWTQVYGRVAISGEAVQIEGESRRLGRYFNVRAYRVGGPESLRVAVLFHDTTENRLAQQRQQAQLERLNLLHQITRAIGERRDLHSIFQVVLDALELRLPIDFGCICLREPGHEQLVVTCTGERSKTLASQMGLAEGARIEIDPNGLSRCLNGYLVHETELADLQFAFPQRLTRGGLVALVAAPLLLESKVFGVLIAARSNGAFTSGECEFLRQLSEHVALAAHQNQLYTDLQQAYENLRQTQQVTLQQERLRALGQMASGIAHDINNAISPIALYTDSLLEREGGLSDHGRGQLQTIQRAIQDVAATVARMREFYRVREPQLMLAPVQLNELVQQVVELTRPRWSTLPQQRGITIEQVSDLQNNLPTIMGAENEIREALTNLVFNAVDAMPQGGRLTLRTHATDNGQVLVEVRDTGVGMDEDSRRRCLEPFYTTKGERGTGLGLAMVYGMAQRHSADIAIESTRGVGTCVRITFTAAERPALESESAPPPVLHGLRILLVDDDPVLLRTLRDILEQDGHTVVAAGGGQQGIDAVKAALARKENFSLVITDLGMPHVDGREVARVLKSLVPRMPVVLLTGWGQRLVSEGQVPPHVDLVLSKPPKLRELREALTNLCGPNAG
jgi:signal transduction histidine kinase